MMPASAPRPLAASLTFLVAILCLRHYGSSMSGESLVLILIEASMLEIGIACELGTNPC